MTRVGPCHSPFTCRSGASHPYSPAFSRSWPPSPSAPAAPTSPTRASSSKLFRVSPSAASKIPACPGRIPTDDTTGKPDAASRAEAATAR
ncbi:hypothetical protein D2F01_01615 [Mycobacteroides abscessus]|nr:hypothetical protein D2F01_01615 [Mycobacteroides abscessus]